MVIDCHTHIDLRPGSQTIPKDLIASIKKAGIDKALVFAGEIFQCSTEKLIAELTPFRDTLFPIGSTSPLSAKPDFKDLEDFLASENILGFKFYNGYEYFYPFDEIVRPFLRLLEKYRLPTFFHSGDPYSENKKAKLKYTHPLHLDDIAVDFPDLTIIIAHFGYPWIIDTAEVSYKNDNVFVDCSGMFYGKPTIEDKDVFHKIFYQFLEYGGEIDKLLFGTDWPFSDQESYVEIIGGLPITSQDKKKILYENALRIFNLR
jgi:predicted TIM-barrel fold metal-dependent hydrolase